MIRRLFSCLPLLAALAGGGCLHPSFSSHARLGPFFTPTNYVGVAKLPESLHRVVLLPICGNEFVPPEAAEALDPVFLTALENQMRFEVVTLSRDECQKSFGVPAISSTDALPPDFLQEVGRKYDAEAVMWVDLTAYQGFRPLTLGVRAKLAMVSNRKLIWAFDQIFSASNPAVANSVRRFYLKGEPSGMPVDLTPAALQSPSHFAAYCASTAFRTLPAP